MILRTITNIYNPSEQFDEIIKNFASKNFTKRHYEPILAQIIQNLIDKNIQNSLTFIKHLSYNQNQIININQPQTCSQCDSNAICINLNNSTPRCKCRKGFIGTGSMGSCFSGTFCSGKFCRLNGRCTYTSNLHGYKCQCMLECLNGGRCAIRAHKYECECLSGFEGPRCLTRTGDLVRDQKFDLIRDKLGLFSQLDYDYKRILNESNHLVLLDFIRKFMQRSENCTKNVHQSGLVFSYN